MPPRKQKATGTKSQISTRSKTISNDSKTEDYDVSRETDPVEITSPATIVFKASTSRKNDDKTLENISKLGLDNLGEEDEDESEEHVMSSEEAKSEGSQHEVKRDSMIVKPNIPKPVKGSQLKKDAQVSAAKLKLSLEEEAKSQRKLKESQFTKEQLKKIQNENIFLTNLQAVMTGTGEPASDIELNDALLLFRDNQDMDLGYFVFYIRGIRKGISKMNNRVDSDLKEICERLNGTHKMYQATQRSLEKTCLEMSSVVFGTGQFKKQKPLIVQPTKSESLYISQPMSTESKPKRKESPGTTIIDVKKSKKSTSKAVPLSSVSNIKEKSEQKLVLENASDYANAMRTTVARIENMIRGKAEILDFFEAAKTFSKENWEKAYKDFDSDFIQKVIDLTKKLGIERAKKEKSKNTQA